MEPILGEELLWALVVLNILCEGCSIWNFNMAFSVMYIYVGGISLTSVSIFPIAFDNFSDSVTVIILQNIQIRLTKVVEKSSIKPMGHIKPYLNDVFLCGLLS